MNIKLVKKILLLSIKKNNETKVGDDRLMVEVETGNEVNS